MPTPAFSHPLVMRGSELESRIDSGFNCAGIPGGKVPRGAVSEFSGKLGSGKTEWLLRELFAKHSAARIAWIESTPGVYPVSFPQNQVTLERVLFIEAGENLLWSAQQVLRSGLFPFVVLHEPPTDLLSLKRLQLAAEKAESAVLLLKTEPTAPPCWALKLQLTWDGSDPTHPWRKLRR
jgi:hypothetical protein